MSAFTPDTAVAALQLDQVLAVADFSSAASNAVWRAALIARERGASLRIVQVVREGRFVARARETACSIATQIHERLGIRPDVEVLEAEKLPEAISAARGAGLFVIGSRRGNPIREWISGAQAERLIRLCRMPTLVVKRSAVPGRHAEFANRSDPGSYGRVLVSVDLDAEAVHLIAAAMRMSRDPQTQIFHALMDAESPKPTGRDGNPMISSQTAVQRAQTMLMDLINASGAQKLGAVAALALGNAARCVLAKERSSGTELVVIGKRQRGLLADFILGGVTQKVLAGSRADVLVMPGTLRLIPARR
jgi:nucleotide-binding universal stress UspA family protein